MNTETCDQDLAPVPENKPWSGPSLASLLGGLGSRVLVAAFSVFLFQQWSDGNDQTRYGLRLIHTLLLTSVGSFSGHWLNLKSAVSC